MDPPSRHLRATTTHPADQIAQCQRLLDSYRHWLGAELIPREGTPEQQATALFAAPFVVVSHGTQSDPILNYANQRALDLWEMDLETFLQTPSRMTAEPVHRDERARLLERTARDGFVDDYRGIRISRTGRRFRIERATVWNLLDQQGNYAGQAATFSSWQELTRTTPADARRDGETTQGHRRGEISGESTTQNSGAR